MTPDDRLPAAAPDTPDPGPPADPEPVEEPEAVEEADQPAAEPDLALGQAEYTRSQQAFSALKAELGLDKRATREEVLAAIKALKAQPADEDGEYEDDEPDPRVVEAEQRAFLAELRVSAAVYGPEFTNDALELTNLLRSTNDPNEIMVAIAAFRDAHSGGAQAPAQVDEEPADEVDPNVVPPPVGLSEGDAGPSARQAISASAARRESGAQSAVRGIFESLGIASRPRQP